MIKKASRYKITIYLILLLALIDLAFFAYLSFFHSELANSVPPRFIIELAVALGLWLHSKIARYLGVIWFPISAASAIWPFFNGSGITMNVSILWVTAIGAISLVTCYLLISKRFATEFSAQRAIEPTHKIKLRKLFYMLVAAAAIVATMYDIYHLVAQG